MEILSKIQKELKAPKMQKNTFGNYMFRSCEDILEAVKPLLGEAVLVLSDEIVLIGDRYYVKATATITTKDCSAHAIAYAREGADKKGMDVAQITGAASSYARKYALNGLFCIDDTKDADSQSNMQENGHIDETQKNTILDSLAELNLPLEGLLKYMKIDKLENMLSVDYAKALALIDAKRRKVGQSK